MQDPIARDFLLTFWKIHILHHAGEDGVYGQWMLEELFIVTATGSARAPSIRCSRVWKRAAGFGARETDPARVAAYIA
jgi:hypothetical protein